MNQVPQNVLGATGIVDRQMVYELFIIHISISSLMVISLRTCTGAYITQSEVEKVGHALKHFG